MASEVISFLERCSVPNIALIFFFLFIFISFIDDYKFSKFSVSYFKEEIRELKQENEKLKGVIHSHGTNDN